MEKKMIKCDELSDSEIQRIISDYENVGWHFVGISEGFPADYSWIHLEWTNSESPISPYKESSS